MDYSFGDIDDDIKISKFNLDECEDLQYATVDLRNQKKQPASSRSNNKSRSGK